MDSDQEWSDESSNMSGGYSDDDPREENNNEPEFGNAPYRFEPLPLAGNDEPEENDMRDEAVNQADRINNIDW